MLPFSFLVEIPTKEEDNLGQATPRMTVIKQKKNVSHATEIGLQPVATSVVTNFTPLYADNIQQKLNNEYVFQSLRLFILSKGESEFFLCLPPLNKKSISFQRVPKSPSGSNIHFSTRFFVIS